MEHTPETCYRAERLQTEVEYLQKGLDERLDDITERLERIEGAVSKDVVETASKEGSVKVLKWGLEFLRWSGVAAGITALFEYMKSRP